MRRRASDEQCLWPRRSAGGPSGLSTRMFDAEVSELRARIPRMLRFAIVCFAGITVLDLILPPPGATVPLRIYLLISGLVATLAPAGMTVLIRKFPQLSAREIDIKLLVLSALLANVLLARSLPMGGVGYFFAAGSLVLVVFSRTVSRPMTDRLALASGIAIWLTYPAGLVIIRLLTGAWPPLPTHMLWAVVSVVSIAAASVFMSMAGASVLYGLRRSRFMAEEAVRYELEGQLGAGGMGEVYAATHGTLKCACAVKVCAVPVGTPPEEAFARFEREAREVARLQHPNIVRVFDYGELDDGRLYYAMEYLPGVDLATFGKEFGPVPEGRLLFWADQILGALADAHRAGIVHRDLKPGNLIVSCLGGEPDVMKVLDFGLARLIMQPEDQSLTRGNEAAGTPWYMSPEQIERRTSEVDGRSDLYALGALLWHLATGRPVFTGDTAMSILVQHVSNAAPSLSDHAEVSPAFAALVARLLAKDPAERFQDAEAVRRALTGCPSWGTWTRELANAWWADHRVQTEERESAESLPTAPLPSGLRESIETAEDVAAPDPV